MGRLGVRRPIPGINTPGRIESIVDDLFSSHAQRLRREWPRGEPIAAVTASEVKTLASTIAENKASGPDAIPGEAVKLIAKSLLKCVAEIFNQCLMQGIFSAAWKRARLVLLRKHSRPLNKPNSYRPLCMLDSMGKLLEKVIDTRLKNICEERELLTANQYGFRRNRSTLDVISRVIYIIRTSLEPRWMVGVLTLDVKNAFNSAP